MKELEQQRLKERSTVLKRNLPRPTAVPKYKPPHLIQGLTPDQQAEELLRAEVEAILIHDSVILGGPSHKAPGDTLEGGHWEKFSDDDILRARRLVDEELEKEPLPSYDQFLEVWQEAFDDIMFVPQMKKFIRSSRATKQQQVASLQGEFETLLDQMKKEAGKAAKLEKKISVYNGGYVSRSESLLKQIKDTYEQIEQTRLEYSCFNALRNKELAAATNRIQKLTNEVEEQAQKEQRLQKKYGNLMVERENAQHPQAGPTLPPASS